MFFDKTLVVIINMTTRDQSDLFVVSHDLSLASRVCDRMVLLGDGEIVAQGAPEEVLTPARVLEVFGIEVQVIASPEGAPIVIPEISTPVRRE